MKTQCVRIVPSPRKTRVADLASGCSGLSRIDTGFLEAACVNSVVVDTELRTCRLELVVWGSVDQDSLDLLRSSLQEAFADCSSVEVEAESRQPCEDLGRWLAEGWGELVTELMDDVPSANGWMATARPRLESECLVVELKNQAGVDHLKGKRVDAALSALILKRAGCSIQVRLCVGDFSEELEAQEMQQREERLRYLGELLSDSEPESRRAKAKAGERNGAGQPILYGRDILAGPSLVSGVVSEDGKVVIQGRVFALESRLLKNGRTLVSFCVSDDSDSIQVKVFDSDQGNLSHSLSEGDWVMVEGAARYDSFSRELVVTARSIVRGKAPTITDEAPVKRVELHLHTKMSAMDSVVDCTEAVRTAAEWGHAAIAVTDHGVVQSFPEAFRAGKKYGIKIIYGMEGYLIDKPDSGSRSDSDGESQDPPGVYHVVILVRDQPGLKNLYRLVSKAHLEHFYKKPRILRSELSELRAGLILGSACESGELFQAIVSGESGERLHEIARYYDYLEIQPIENNSFMLRSGKVGARKDLEDINRKIVEIGRELGKPVVATGDVHFLRPRDSAYRAILMAGQKYEDADNQAPLYFRTTEEMLREFEYLGDSEAASVVVEAPNEIAAMVEDGIRPLPEGLHSPKIAGAEEEIRSMSFANAHLIYGEPLPDVVEERLQKELSAIIDNGFAVNYLIAHRVVSRSLQAGYQVGSRGSVGSSLVATMCHISEVNPLPPHYVCTSCKYSEFVPSGTAGTGFDLPAKNCPGCGLPLKKDGVDIPFETFLGFDGDKIPDIDLNFADVYLGEIHRFTEELFGSDRIYRAGTVATIADKTAYGFVRAYVEERGMALRGAEVTRMVRGVTGVKRSTGQHPGGLLVVPDGYDICDFCPVQYPADNKESRVITSHFSYHDSGIDECLTKLDLLGKVDPTTLKMLQDLTGLDPSDIPLDDPDTLALFSGVERLGISSDDLGLAIGSLGIPEFNTPFLRQILEDVRPTTFDELIKIMGLSHGKDVWLNNAQDLISSGKTSSLSEVICCRDDIMLALIHKGLDKAHAFSITEKVRKGRPLNDDDEHAMKRVGMPDWYLDSCKKITYLFPKAHAAAYVIMAVRLAYFKIHHPLEFYAAYLSTRCDSFDAVAAADGIDAVRARIEEIRSKGDEATSRECVLADELEVILEAQLRGVKFLPVDIYRSEPRVVVIQDGSLRMPFVSIPGLGTAAGESIVLAREDKPFTSLEDLRSRTKLTKTLVDMMYSMGILRDLPETDQLSLFA